MLRKHAIKMLKENRENIGFLHGPVIHSREQSSTVFLISNKIGLKSIYMPHYLTCILP